MISSNRSVDALATRIIGAAIEVHRALGPGLMESAYEKCLEHEFKLQGISFETQVAIPVIYKGINLECGYRADIIVEKQIILELKTVESILPVHEAQLLTYLKLTHLKLGYILNFNNSVLKKGIKRIIR